MFGFMKKLTDKDKEEKERKRKERLEKEHKKLNNGMTADELIRLEEARQSLQQKKNSTTPAASSTPGDFTFRSQTSSGSIKNSRGPPPIIHPKPLRRGYSKDKSNVPSGPQKDLKYKSEVNFQSEAGIALEVASPENNIEINSNSMHEKEIPLKKLFSSRAKKSGDVHAEGNVKLVGVRANKMTNSTNKSAPFVRTESPTNKIYDILSHKLAPLAPVNQMEPRKITLKRLQSGDFGFSLRKGITVIRKSKPSESDLWTQVIFAESGSKNIDLGFLPGDGIVEVGHSNVESSNRETIVEILKKSGSEVEVIVRTIPEMNEVVHRMRKNHQVHGKQESTKTSEAKSDEQLVSDQLNLTCSDIWLIHQDGYSPGKLLEKNAEGNLKVELEPGMVIQVTEQDVEKVNPSYLDRIEDVTLLRFVNESSLLHTLRQRYYSNLIHTSAGFSTIVINSVHPLSIYSDKIAQFFKETKPCDQPPHIFRVAQSAFKAMMSTRQDQSIVLLGRSGSGKTFNAQGILNYFVVAHGSVQSVLTCDKLSAISTLMDGFASSKTHSGFNSSKVTQLFSLDFDQNGQIVSASLQAMMLEKVCEATESSFNIFNHFINGIDSNLRKELRLDEPDQLNRSILGSLRSSEEVLSKAPQNWAKTLNSFKQLKISDGEVKAICLVLASICHLQLAGAAKGPNNKHQFKNMSSAESAAKLLGTPVDDLSKVVFQGVTNQHGSSLSSLSPALRIAPSKENISSLYSGGELLVMFNSGLYAEVFNAIMALINRSLSSNCRITASIMVVDAPGFRSNPVDRGARLSDLFHNYVQERLQNLFHENIFNSTQELYSQEGIDLDFDFPEPYSSVLIQSIDAPPRNLTRSPDRDGGNLMSNRGLFWILDEESLLPTTSDEVFLQDFLDECSIFKLKTPMLMEGSSQTTFVMNHMNGSCPVEYDTTGWVRATREGAVVKNAGNLLMDSKRAEICELFTQTCKTVGGATIGGSLVGVVDAPSTLRRANSIKRGFTAVGARKRLLCLQIKFQTDALMDTLKRSRTSFIHCLCPHDSTHHPDVVNVPLLRKQIRSSLVLQSIRLFKQGFPENISFSEFINKFRILSSNPSMSVDSVDREVVEQVLMSLDIDPSMYRLGTTKVFFHNGVLNQLESIKENGISNWLVNLQSLCKLHLARRNLKKLKLQQTAISCVQRNVKKFMLVRDWSWWRLFLKVKPLLNVHRTEEELRDMQYEVDLLKQRLEKSEKDKQDYKQALERMESKMTELALELQDEQSTAVQASEMLENETERRLLLEKQVRDLQAKYKDLQGQSREMEAELMNLRMISNAIESDTEDDIGDSVYKERYERSRKQHDCSVKRMELDFESQRDQLEASKRTLEKKIADMTLEEERLEKQSSDLKRKLQKHSQEMADVKMHLQEQVTRNSELEKKQRRFDVDQSKLSDLLKEEKSLREKLQKEKDDVIGQKFSMEKDYKNLVMDFDLQSQKLRKLESEVLDLVSIGKDDKEAVKTRQLKNELEGKIKDLEEELDEQAGTIQQLEQAKLRLEMSQERLRQQHSKEIEEKENDLEDVKRSFQKKFKTLEVQLEEEYEEKQRYLRDKRDLEKKIQVVAGEKPARDKDMEALLKRDLRRTKALLQDAQLMLNKYKESAGSRQTVKQLRDQLEDAEFATSAALKAKKSMELELNDLHQQLDNMNKVKNEVEDKYVCANKDKHELQSRLEEADEEMSELMKKYKASVQQHSLDLIKFEDQSRQIESLNQERENLKEEISRLQSRTDYFETSTVDRETISRLEVKIRDLEAKLDLEQTTRRRTEVQLSRLREQMESESDSRQSLKTEETRVQDLLRQSQRKVKEMEDEVNELKFKESEAVKRKQELERKFEEMESEHEQAQNDLHLAFKRIADLQAVIEDDIETNNDSCDSDIDIQDSDDSDNIVNITRN